MSIESHRILRKIFSRNLFRQTRSRFSYFNRSRNKLEKLCSKRVIFDAWWCILSDMDTKIHCIKGQHRQRTVVLIRNSSRPWTVVHIIRLGLWKDYQYRINIDQTTHHQSVLFLCLSVNKMVPRSSIATPVYFQWSKYN